MILAGDVGGTKVNLAAFEMRDSQLVPARTGSYSSREFPTLQSILHDFIGLHGLSIQHVSLGLAGPVKDGRARLTNLPWTVDTAALVEALGVESAWLLNDLEATAYSLPVLRSDELVVLNPGEPGATGNAGILAAGTGLGEAGLYWDGRRHHPFACEGGHTDFAPRTDLEVELFQYLRGRYGRVSGERVLSGKGLFQIYEFLRDSGRGTESPALSAELQTGDPPAVISRAGLEGRCALCAQALDVFVACYGAEAGNLALKLMATGGIYVSGGIAPKILPKMRQPLFLNAFLDAGRVRFLLEAMPVAIILNEKAPLIGAARFAALKASWID